MSPCQKHWKTQWIMKLHEGPLLKYWCLFSHCYRVLAGPNTYVTYVCIRFARLMFHEYKGMNFQFHWKWDVSLLSSASKKLRKKLYGIGLWHIYIYILVIQLYIIFVHIKYKHCIHTCFFSRTSQDLRLKGQTPTVPRQFTLKSRNIKDSSARNRETGEKTLGFGGPYK